MQTYSNPKDADKPNRLPDAEVWQDRVATVACGCGTYDVPEDEAYAESKSYCPSCAQPGATRHKTRRMAWWYRYCSPGCLPDSDTYGPYDSRDEAECALRDNAGAYDCPDDEDDDDE